MECIDEDECKTGKPCHDKATCKNTVGSFECNCFPGYRSVGDYEGYNCADIVECLTCYDIEKNPVYVISEYADLFTEYNCPSELSSDTNCQQDSEVRWLQLSYQVAIFVT